jgi:protein-S-isoprenylcysteine O-methyltransferase Ste14
MMVFDLPERKRLPTVERKRARPARIGVCEGLIALVSALCFLVLFFIWFVMLRHVPPEIADWCAILVFFACGLLFSISSACHKSRIGWILAGLSLAILIVLAARIVLVEFR